MKRLLLSVVLFASLIFNNSCDLLDSDPTKSDLKSISGNFDNWTLGNDKVLRYGIEDNSGKFILLGSTQISNNGFFKLDSLIIPQDYLFDAVGEGPFENNCTGSLTISNKGAQVANASFIVTEQDPNKVIGKVYHATDEMKDKVSLSVGGFYTEYIYAKDTVAMRGEKICLGENGASYKNQIDAKLKIGWNKVIFKTTEINQNSSTVLISTRLSSGGRWFFTDERPILQSEYDINIDAKFEYWYEGSGKQLQLGEYNYQTNQFFPFAYADISSDGRFAITKTKSPETMFLRQPQNLYADQMNCSINIAASDTKAVVATSRMIIVDKANQKLISEVYYGIDINKNGSRDAGDSEFNFVFADRPVTVKGESSCNFTNQNGEASKDNSTVDLSLQKGWNKIQTKFIEFSQTANKKELTNASSGSGGWYYQPTQPDLSGTFPLSLNGKFEFWQEGTGKALIIGETNYQTQELVRFASADISPLGEFATVSAIAPSQTFLRQAQYLYIDPNTCSNTITISDYNARVATAHFFILDKNGGQRVGVASFGYDAAKNARMDPGDYQISLVFSDRDVNMSGESSCDQKDPNGNPFTDAREYDLALKKGWNVITELILDINASYRKIRLSAGLPSQGSWYYGK